MPRTHTVICTAGHIDHGKSSLIISLTGYNPDRLREEQEREMTIELGFAFYGDDVTFIDVPGHEKFLKTMLAGVSSVDGAVLVVAADDGVMPQTREHFEVLQLLGIDRGIIVLTKIDLTDEEWIALVNEDIRELTRGTFLEGAPILPVSNRTGAGMEEFRTALDRLIASARPRSDRGLFRMWLDRAFTIKGAGTIVAGTVLSGKVKTGDTVEILPAGTVARVKRIQAHNKDVEAGTIGERAALNLPGVNKDDVGRGDLLATPDHYRPTYMLNARLNLLASAAKQLEQRTRLRLHLGSSEHICRVILLENRPIQPGESELVQFRLEDQAMADVGDRYVVRSFSEGRVLGGGLILEIHPKKMKSADSEEIERLKRLESAEPREIVRQYIEKVGDQTADAAEIARQLAFPQGEVIDILGAMQRDGEVRVLQPSPRWLVVSAGLFDTLQEKVVRFLSEFHKSEPHLKGARRSDLKSRLMPSAAQVLYDRLLEELKRDQRIELEAEIVRQTGHIIQFSPRQEELKERIARVYLERGFVTPEPEELAGELDLDISDVEPIIIGLCELGELLKLHGPDGKPLFYHREAIDEARKLLVGFFKDHTEMRFFEFRELIGSTRKFTTPILMHFDDLGITYRDGDVRRLKNNK